MSVPEEHHTAARNYKYVLPLAMMISYPSNYLFLYNISDRWSMEIQREHETEIYVVRQDRHGEDVEIVEASNVDSSIVATSSQSRHTPKPISLVRLFLACMVAGGVQYGWALQLSLLTPYIQVCFFETKHKSSTTLHAYTRACRHFHHASCLMLVRDVAFIFI